LDRLTEILQESDLTSEERSTLDAYLRDRLADVTSTQLPQQVALIAAASIMGRIGGRVRSMEKTAAARRNGRKGGRPRKVHS